MNKYIEAPNLDAGPLSMWNTVFLAGSISGAHDWQKEAAAKLLPYFNVFNPRRKDFDASNPNIEREQIMWEHSHLRKCRHVLFYFSYETLAPITLLELGATLERSKHVDFQNIYIAVHPEYKRKNDVLIQTELQNRLAWHEITFDLNESIEGLIKNQNIPLILTIDLGT